MKEVPTTEHWAIVTTRNIYIPGDDRSRTNPGHGYPASTEQVIHYESFTNFDLFKEAVSRKIFSGQKYKAFKCSPVAFDVDVRMVIS